MDTLTSDQRSARMRRVRHKDTKPEMAVRRLVHGMGYRYRLHTSGLPGKPDLVFPGRHKIILVHGCFWHRHPDPACRLARMPKSRQDFWEPKLASNRRRDDIVADQLAAVGGDVLTVWECELGRKAELAANVQQFLGER